MYNNRHGGFRGLQCAYAALTHIYTYTIPPNLPLSSRMFRLNLLLSHPYSHKFPCKLRQIKSGGECSRFPPPRLPNQNNTIYRHGHRNVVEHQRCDSSGENTFATSNSTRNTYTVTSVGALAYFTWNEDISCRQ